MVITTQPDPSVFLELIRHAPALEVLQDESLDRRELERRLDISRATSHRWTKTLDELGLIERPGGEFRLTELGEAITEAVLGFKAQVRTMLRLAPVLEAVCETTPRIDLSAFNDATITSAEHGDSHSPLIRFSTLIEETDTLRGIDVESIAPPYTEAFQQRILDGMETELVHHPDVAENIMESYPEKCVQVCTSGHFTLWLWPHGALPYSLVLFDDRIGIGVRYPNTMTLRLFVDTDSLAAREWAEAVYESHRSEAIHLDTFTIQGLRNAMASD